LATEWHEQDHLKHRMTSFVLVTNMNASPDRFGADSHPHLQPRKEAMIKNRTMRAALGMVIFTLAAQPLEGQGAPGSTDPAMMAVQLSASTMKPWLTKAGEQMSDADFAYRPTPDVRTFGQLLAHVADLNNLFCSAAIGEKPVVAGLEKSATTRADILSAMAASFALCDEVYASMTETSARKTVALMGNAMPALTVLLFRTHHLSLHYGNAVTYMRLRGKVPPSTAGMP
jgi:uncharacterized damage-inducible protein DinB